MERAFSCAGRGGRQGDREAQTWWEIEKRGANTFTVIGATRWYDASSYHDQTAPLLSLQCRKTIPRLGRLTVIETIIQVVAP